MRFDSRTIRSLGAEFLCTFIFIFCICGNGLNEMKNEMKGAVAVKIGSIGGAISTAFVAVAIIYAFGPHSGAHFNPAVTAGAMIGGKIDPVLGVLYIVLQLLAGVAAVGLWAFFFPDSGAAKALLLSPPSGVNLIAAVVMEALLSFILVLVIYNTAMGVKIEAPEGDIESGEEQAALLAQNRARLNFAPIAIGLTLGFLCFLGGHVSGGAFNPSRATAPAVLTMDFDSLWIYWVGDLCGAVLAAVIGRFFFERL